MRDETGKCERGRGADQRSTASVQRWRFVRPSHAAITSHASYFRASRRLAVDYVPKIGDIVSVGGQFTTCVVEVNRKDRTANLKAADGRLRMTNIPWPALTLLTRPA
jgi:hypothetical protein